MTAVTSFATIFAVLATSSGSALSGRLYTGLDLTGESYNYDLGNLAQSTYEGCTLLPRTDFKSVDTEQGCIRIYPNDYCHGQSLAIYPGADNSPNILNLEFAKTVSLGPCLSNEFEFSHLSIHNNQVQFVKNLTNVEAIPDQTLIGGVHQYQPISTSVTWWNESSMNPVISYLLDDNSRILYLWAVIYKRHLNPAAAAAGSVNMKENPAWASFEKREGDDLGFVIPPSMSGLGNETYNIFPQSQRNAAEWNNVLSKVPTFIVEESASNWFSLFVNFAYPNESTNRPHGFYYQAEIFRPSLKLKVMNGFVRN